MYIANYDKALGYFQKGLRQSQHQHEEPLRTPLCYNEIGMTYRNEGDYNKALEYYTQALAIREAVLGGNHLDVAYSCNNIGSVYRGMKDFEKALEYYHKALAILEEKLGPDHKNSKAVRAKISEVEEISTSSSR